MGDQTTTVGKLTASLEELSLKKQLPLRQQVQKPMLKYNNSLVKPVQLFNHAEFASMGGNADGRSSAYSSLSQASTNSVMSTPFRSPAKPPPSTQPVTRNYGMPPGPTRGEPQIGSSPTKSASTKGHSNPYARPLSAKDIVNDLQNQKIKKCSSSSQMASGSTSSIGSAGSGTPMFGFTMNAFMRPQSAVKKDPPTNHPKPVQKPASSASSDNSKEGKGNQETNDKNQSKVSSPAKMPKEPREQVGEGAATGQNSQMPSQNSTAQNTAVNKVNNVTSVNKYAGMSATRTIANRPVGTTENKGNSASTNKTASTSISATSSNNTSRVTSNSASQTQQSAVAKDGDSKTSVVSKQGNTTGIQDQKTSPAKAVIFAKPVSSLPRPGSAAPHKPTTPESPAKVRNLNYTPTKPYSEVNDPGQVTQVVGKPPISATNKTQQTMATVTAIFAEQSKDMSAYNAFPQRSTYDKPSAQVKTSTSYYTKSKMESVVVHEQRPPVVGAPAKPQKVSEKGAIAGAGMEYEDDDEEESENGAPSGERLPGDGEASLDEYDEDDEDDDAIDGLEDDYLGGSDGESDGYSFTSSLSRRSSSSHLRSSSRRNRPISGISHDEEPRSRPMTAIAAKPALTPSLFPNIPPTVTFIAEGEKVEQLAWDIRKLLKWRLSPITPNVVKGTLARSGFRITKRNHDWLGCWGKHMKSPGFKALREYQKLNHFPGSFQIGRKDRLWRNLSKMQVHFGKKEFGFFPQTFCLPFDNKLLKRAWEDGGNKQKWIIKPPASARGIGIKVISKWTQIPRRKPVIVQKYLSRPYLINDSKFDLRIYVYVSCYDPLRLYVFEDGLARFASMKYSSSMKNLNNKFMHLTNYSVNKKNAEYQANSDDTVCQGHKWSLKALWNYMKRQGINTNAVWDSIKDLITKTIICADAAVNSLVKANCRSRYTVHELFGFDILLDENLKPWILEVNISPSLHSNSQLDINIKGHMIRDLMNIAGFRVPDKHDVSHHNASSSSSGTTDFSMYIPPNNFCMDKRLYTQVLSPDERAKHAYYSQRHTDEQALQTMLDTLTPDDIRVLTESIDEDSRKGGFQRIFPTPSTHKYLKYFEQSRYYNLMLDQWVQRYNRMEQRGISILQSYCEDGIHLEITTDNHHHQWNPPNATCYSYREPRLLSAPPSKMKENKDGETSPIKSSSSASNLPKFYKKQKLQSQLQQQLQANSAAVAHQPHQQRSVSQSSSTSSVNTVVLSPRPVDSVTPKSSANSR